MGDGGVACAPSQLIMDNFSVCGGGGGGKANGNSSVKLATSTTKVKPKMKKVKKVKKSKKGAGAGADSDNKKKNNNNNVSVSVSTAEVSKDTKGEVSVNVNDDSKEEVEEGELGTLPIENLEFVQPERPPPRRYEIRSEIEKGEFVPGRWRRNAGELDRNSKDELEKGEFVPERWYNRNDAGYNNKGDQYSYSKTSRRYDPPKDKGWKGDREWASPSSKERGWKFDRDSEWSQPSGKEKVWKADYDWSPPSGKEKGWKCERTPPPPPPASGKYNNEKEFRKSGGGSQQFRKFASRYEADRTPKNSYKVAGGEEGFVKTDISNGKNHARDYPFNNRLKRHGNDSDSGERKYNVDYDDYASSKNRKLSDEGGRFSSDHYSGRGFKKASSSSSRTIPPERYSSRYSDSSRSLNDRRISSPHQSPSERTRNYDRAHSPARRDKSPNDRGHQQDRSMSPYDRSRRYDNRFHSPGHVPRSPRDSGRNRDDRDRSPYVERSPQDRGRYSGQRDTYRKGGVGEKRSNGHKDQEGRYSMKGLVGRETQTSAKESDDREKLENGNCSSDKAANSLRHGEELHSIPLGNLESFLENGVTEEPASMEEDMDICDTPPHVPVVIDAFSGKWYYLDQSGEERGPTKLCDLRTLVDEGHLASDHFIKHFDGDRWVTVENAVSPLMPANFPSVVPESITQLVSPPEAPGNLLEDNGKGTPSNLHDEELLPQAPSLIISPTHNGLAAPETGEDLRIDERVEEFLKGITFIPGKELEKIAEVLEMTIEHGDWENWEKLEGYFRNQLHIVEHCDDKGAEESSGVSEYELKDPAESLSSERDIELCCTDASEWFSGQWALKGGDWKINDESTIDKHWKRKLVLNDGYPLCQMPKSGCEDPRWQRKDELYYPSLSRRLDLPSWAFSVEEMNDPSSRPSQLKSVLSRGSKGTMLPVIRINACVVSDHGSFISEPRGKGKGKERFSGKSSRPYSTTGDTKRSSEDSHSKSSHELDSHDSWKKTASFTIPKDRLCRVDELQLHLGDWYYLDGAGHERGPSSFSELQGMAEHGVIQKQSSVFRKHDKLWVPLNLPLELPGITEHENSVTSSTSHSEARGAISGQSASGGFHDSHPQFIGFTRGKLHELVMKSYKSREFAAAINEVLDPWINARQPKKEMEKYTYDNFRSSKRARTDGTEEEYGIGEDESQKDDCSFDDLCSDTTFNTGIESVSEVESDSWDLLNGHVLARIFHFLRADLKSLIQAALTCKHWRSAVKFYKDISRQVDFSSTAPNGSDPIILKIMNEYNREKITSLILHSCTGITSGLLEELLPSLPCLSSVDIRGCPQLEDLVGKFPHINWIRSFPQQHKVRSLNHLTDKGPSTSNQMEYSSGLKEYLENSAKRDSANQLFRRSLYKRSKLFDARRSSSISSRDAQLRRLAMKKYGNGYKRMEEFIASSLRDIMKNNTFEFFEAKVADIEERMKNGHYASRGLNSVKEDISRMCRDAIKTKTRGDARDLNRIVTLFIQLATSLENSSKLAYGKDEMMKSWKDFIPPGFLSASSKYKKNLTKVSEKKQSYRSNGSSFVNAYIDSGDYASDREIRRRLSKLNKKSLDSGSDTSDDFDKSSLGSETDRESTASETESDIELQSGTSTRESRKEAQFTPDYGFDSFADDREWGARMTKASLVPPVTRKYEVIDHYVIVADEEEVKRKMQVSLPEDYDEKVISQRNGTEESDMEIPEVKDYKPRKSLGDEVIEQEVYGIDPYTHNLLLDSMPDESDWSLVDKHLFIEDVLLRSLNKLVRNFTGSGNTPMVYPLKPVFEEIVETARENYDKRTMRLCQFILKAIDSRPEDKYVAYRKGLGVLCNKEGGFSQEDFVVEFLGEVYPTWKWYEKQDGIRALQKNKDEPAPEFYNIYLERPKGDADGYDLVVVDAMHKANYASRICHSCKPNCEAKVTAVDGQYQIGIYSVRPIAYGEEITFDYNSVTESKEEYEASVCLCGNQVCRGSYLNLTGEGAYQKVLKQHHGLLDRHRMLLEACELNSVSEEDYIDLGKAGLGSCLLGGLPDWLIAYSARLVRFINFERTELPNEIFRHNVEEKKKYFAEIQFDVEKSDAEIQAEGVYNQRLQNLALTIDKVRYVMRCVFGDPKSAPPPLERLSPEAAVSYLWKGEGSFVDELIQCMSPHMEDVTLREMKAKIHAHDPSASDDVERELRKSLLWLRDELRKLPCTYKVRHDAAADLIHIHAYTKSFIRMREYKKVTSPPVYITAMDVGPKYADKLGPGVHEYCKTYGETYCLGQLMFWYNQSAEPDAILEKASRGCLSLPDVGSFYAKVQQPSRQRVYGPKTVKFMLSRMEKQPQRSWPKDQIWSFKSSVRVVGSPMLDAVLHDSAVDKEMVNWLKHRESVYQAMWDR